MTQGYLLLPLLSLDTFLLSVALAKTAPPRRLLLLLTLAEGLAPLLGYAFGRLFFAAIAASVMHIVAGVLLLALALVLAFGAREDPEEEMETLSRAPLLGMAAVGADEFGFGVVLPALHTQVVFAVIWLLLQAPVAVLLGLALGRRLNLSDRLRYAPAFLVALLAVWQLVAP